MNRDELTQTVKKLIAQETDLPVTAIEENCTLADLGVDSLDVLKLAIAFEQHFDIAISTADLMNIRTVGDIVDELERKVMVA